MKNKKIITFLIIIIILSVFLLFYANKDKIQKVLQTNSEITDNINEYDEKINKMVEIETNNEQEESIITIIENEAKTKEDAIYITNKDIEFLKVLDSTEKDLKEVAIENKIYTKEAQKMGITLSQDEIEEIEKISNSDEILKYVQDDDVTYNSFKERVKKYLIENRYTRALKDKILEEIDNNKISIENEIIDDKMKEYTTLKNNFKDIENPTEEEKQEYLKHIFSLYYEIEELYLKAIKDKYIIQFEN